MTLGLGAGGSAHLEMPTGLGVRHSEQRVWAWIDENGGKMQKNVIAWLVPQALLQHPP